MDKVTSKSLRPGDAGVSDTIDLMIEYAREYSVNPGIRRIAESLSDYCEECTLRKIFNYVVRKIKYKLDPPATELVKSPKHTILGTKNYGDCDDLSVALASLLIAAGFKTAYKTIAWKPGLSKDFSHVYVMVGFDNGWIPLDPTMGLIGFGNEVRNIRRSRVWVI